MADSSKNSTTWEEEVYWRNFHVVHFSVLLPNDFHHGLKIPKKFTHYMSTYLPEKVVLKVNGVAWNVNLKKVKDDIMFEGDEWQEFLEAYALKKADMVVFKYNRNDCFEVLLFNGANLCEKEASYFVRKGKLQKYVGDEFDGETKNLNGELTDHRSQKRNSNCDRARRSNCRKNTCRTQKDNSSEEYTTRIQDEDDSDFALKKRHKAHIYGTPKDNMSEELTDRSQGEDDSDYSPTNKDGENTDGDIDGKRADGGTIGEVTSNSSKKRRHAEKSTTKGNSPHGAFYKSNRRPVTEAEKDKALTMANSMSAKHESSFAIVMRPSCVYKLFTLSIPSQWRPDHVFRNGEEVMLRFKEKTWPCTFSSSVNNGGFRGGWKKFALDNSLEEFDVCVFVPIGRKGGKFMLDVRIYRVVPEVVPPSPATPY